MLFVPCVARAYIGSYDEREYVDWSAAPYNKIVLIKGNTFSADWVSVTCAGQYVAPDIILTARHCLIYSTGYDGNQMVGETNIQLPGANVLLPIYNEYTTLAADLKTRKEALGMTPGIESEVILDAATSGLYDNAATGITDGAYTSLSRALSDPTGADAAEWAAQKSDTLSQLKTGAIVGGAGVAGGAVGDVLINNVFDGVGKNNASDDNKK